MRLIYSITACLLILLGAHQANAAVAINDPEDKNGNIVEGVINSITPIPGTDVGNLILLLNTPPPYVIVPSVLSQMSPDLHGDLPFIQLVVSSQITELFSRHSQSLRTHNNLEDKTNIWIQPFVEIRKRKDAPYFPGYEARVYGTIWGLDYFFDNPELAGGIAGAYAYTDMQWVSNGGIGGSHSFFFGPYFSFNKTDKRCSGPYLDFALLAHYHRSGTARFIPNLLLSANSKHDSLGICGKVGGGYNYYLETVVISPFATADYVFIHENSFQESGAPGANLDIKERNSDLLRFEVGSEIRQTFKLSREWSISPSIKASWVHKHPLLRSPVTAAFIGYQDFKVRPYDRVLNQFSPGVVLSVNNDDYLVISAYYDLEIGSNQRSHEVGITGSLRY